MDLITKVTKENLDRLVMTFYAKVLKDETLSPIFISVLGDDMKSDIWKPHLKTIKAFWALVALGDDEYKGSPLSPHLHIKGLTADAFSQWLVLFFQTVDNLYVPPIAASFKQRATIIAGNFMRALKIS